MGCRHYSFEKLPQFTPKGSHSGDPLLVQSPQCTGRETEAQRKVTGPRSHSQLVAKTELKTKTPDGQIGTACLMVEVSDGVCLAHLGPAAVKNERMAPGDPSPCMNPLLEMGEPVNVGAVTPVVPLPYEAKGIYQLSLTSSEGPLSRWAESNHTSPLEAVLSSWWPEKDSVSCCLL